MALLKKRQVRDVAVCGCQGECDSRATLRYKEGRNGSDCLAVCYGYGFTVNGEKNAETNLVEMCPKGAE